MDSGWVSSGKCLGILSFEQSENDNKGNWSFTYMACPFKLVFRRISNVCSVQLPLDHINQSASGLSKLTISNILHCWNLINLFILDVTCTYNPNFSYKVSGWNISLWYGHWKDFIDNGSFAVRQIEMYLQYVKHRYEFINRVSRLLPSSSR